jgi:hypothetical protein
MAVTVKLADCLNGINNGDDGNGDGRVERVEGQKGVAVVKQQHLRQN